jgi:hypothetical protein
LVVDADADEATGGTPSGVLLSANAAYTDVGSVALGGVIAHDGFASVVDADFAIRASGGSARRAVRQLTFAFRANFCCCTIALAVAVGRPFCPALVVDADFRVNATRATPSGVLLSADTAYTDAGSEAVGGVAAHDGLAFAPNADFAIDASVTGATPRGVILRQLAFAFHAGFDC